MGHHPRPLLLFLLLVLECMMPVQSSSEPWPYDPVLALRLVKFAFASYEYEYDKIPAWNCSCCLLLDKVTEPVYFNSTEKNLFGFVAKDNVLGGATVVSFRGTVNTSLRNWIQDLDASHLEPYNGDPSIAVHKGFFDDYAALRDQVHQLVLSHESSRVFVTGHSLGAALATLCALDLQVSFPDMTVSTISYGTPRSGNSAFSEYYANVLGGRSWRVVHWKDIVPSLPPQVLGFMHTPQEAFYDKSFNLIATCEEAESKHCSDSVIADSIMMHLSYFNMSHYDCRPNAN